MNARPHPGPVASQARHESVSRGGTFASRIVVPLRRGWALPPRRCCLDRGCSPRPRVFRAKTPTHRTGWAQVDTFAPEVRVSVAISQKAVCVVGGESAKPIRSDMAKGRILGWFHFNARCNTSARFVVAKETWFC